jgi:signal transduction histidine kinase
MDASTISTLIGAILGGVGLVVAITLAFLFQRQSKEVREATSRTAQDLKTVILADEEESKRILFRIEDYLQTMRSFQESLEKPLQQERQEIRTLSKSLSATAEDYEYILTQLKKDFPDLRSILDQSKRIDQILTQLSASLSTQLQALKNENLVAFNNLRTDFQQLQRSTDYLSKDLYVANQRTSTTSNSPNTIPIKLDSEIIVELRSLNIDVSHNLTLMNQLIKLLSEAISTYQASLVTTVSTFRYEIKDLIDNWSRDLSVLDRKVPQLLEPSKSYEISAVDKLLIYQQVSNEYVHNITTPLASIDSAVVNIKDRLPLLLQTSTALPAESASILLSSLENATFSIETIKSILRQSAGFLADGAKRFSIEVLIRKAIRMVTTAGPDREMPTVTLDNLPDVKYHPTILLIALVQVLGNAYEASEPDGMISIYGKYDASTEKVEILISNNGKPINSEVQHKIFEPGFSTKGPGHGLGLAIARRHLEAADGEIDLLSSDTNQTTFKISFKPEEVYQLK